MLTFDAASVSQSLLRRLPEQPARFPIHSVFDHAWNVALDGKLLLTIASARSGNLPGGVLVPEAEWPAVAGAAPGAGDPTYVDLHGIYLPSREIRISLDSAKRWQPSLTIGQTATKEELERRIPQAIRFFQQTKPAPGMPALTAALESRTMDIERALSQEDTVGLAAAAAGLVGLGLGLTPSGDDILVGAMVALCMLEPLYPSAGKSARALMAPMKKLAGGTTAVAASYLSYASDGAFSEVAIDFARDLLAEASGWMTSAAKLRNVGATSGSDLALGVVTTVRAIVGVAPPA